MAAALYGSATFFYRRAQSRRTLPCNCALPVLSTGRTGEKPDGNPAACQRPGFHKRRAASGRWIRRKVPPIFHRALKRWQAGRDPAQTPRRNTATLPRARCASAKSTGTPRAHSGSNRQQRAGQGIAVGVTRASGNAAGTSPANSASTQIDGKPANPDPSHVCPHHRCHPHTTPTDSSRSGRCVGITTKRW